MFRNNKLFRKITAPYVDNPCMKNGTVYTYPAVVIDTGGDYIVSSLKYENRPDLDFGIPFSFDFNYGDMSVHETDVHIIKLYTHIKETADAYAAQYIPGTIFTPEDLNDFCLFIYKKNRLQKMTDSYNVTIYRNCRKYAELNDIQTIPDIFLGGDAFGIRLSCFRFDRTGFSFHKGTYPVRAALIEGKEYSEKALNLSFSEWNGIFSDSLNYACNLTELYSPDNVLPANSESLKWDSGDLVKWICPLGHVWEAPVSQYTVEVQSENPCPVCRKYLPAIRPRETDFSLRIIDKIKTAMKDYGTNDLKKLRNLLTCEYGRQKEALDRMLNSGGSEWIEEENMPSSIDYWFVYPAGKQADIDMYICSQYGDVNEIQGFLYQAKIPVSFREQLPYLYESSTWIPDYYRETLSVDYSTEQIQRILSNQDISDFLWRHHRYYKTRKLSLLLVALSSYQLNDYDVYRELLPYAPKAKTYRERIYNQLIFEGKSSGKWVSEQSLYRIIRTFFQDAIYQYHTDWLGAQSLDIYIPSVNVGIEYQGAQHYEPIELFGGEEGLKERKSLDRKKRILCKKNGVLLLEWRYTKEITRQAVYELLYEWLRKQGASDTCFVKKQN